MVKSAAQIRRNLARAAARGDTYTPPEPTAKEPEEKSAPDDGDGESEEVIQTKSTAAQKLEEALATLETNPDDLNAKERRSAKRKAEAVAAEEAGCDATELAEWYKKHKAATTTTRNKKKGNKNQQAKNNNQAAIDQLSEEDKTKLRLAKDLHESLSNLEKDESLNAKDRRSAKRKAEAIVAEEAGTPAKELLEWYEKLVPPAASNDDDEQKGKKIPYIVFVGQLSYTTTSDMLYDHFLGTLGKEVITKESIKIRLLTDSKTKKSRGMAFVELDSPEIMYECLKLHLTHLDGRRINVERSAGGGTAAKKARITTFKEKQSTYISETMDQIIQTFVKSGDIEPEELDEGVIGLCKRHSATVVEAALKEYAQEKKERKMKKETLGEKEEEELRNPSAFLTHMLGRIAEEGIGNSSKGKSRGSGAGGGRGQGDGGRGGRGGGPGRGGSWRGGSGGRGGGGRGDGAATASGHGSIFQKSGVDMSISSGRGAGRNISEIFPSMGRGRGRGRGYM